jgi:hypothetical protein
LAAARGDDARWRSEAAAWAATRLRLEAQAAELQRDAGRAAAARAAAEARADELATQLAAVRSAHLQLARQHADASGPAAAAGAQLALQQAVDGAVRACKREGKREAGLQLAALEELRNQAEADAAHAHAELAALQEALAAAAAAQLRAAAAAAASGHREAELEASNRRLSEAVAQLRAHAAVQVAAAAASPRPASPRSTSWSSSGPRRGKSPAPEAYASANSSPQGSPGGGVAAFDSPEPRRGRRVGRAASMAEKALAPDEDAAATLPGSTSGGGAAVAAGRPDEVLPPSQTEPKSSRWGDAINPNAAVTRHRSASGSERPRKDSEDGSWIKRSAFFPPADARAAGGTPKKDAARWRSDKADHDPTELLQPVGSSEAHPSSGGSDAPGSSQGGLESLLASVTLKPTDTNASGSLRQAAVERTSPPSLPIAQVALKPTVRRLSAHAAATTAPTAAAPVDSFGAGSLAEEAAAARPASPRATETAPSPLLTSPLLSAGTAPRPITPEKTRKL